jgi:cephalosporin hydroxylase
VIAANPLSFCPELEAMVTSQRVVGRCGKTFERLGALSSVNNLIILRNLCLTLKPQKTMEIGLSFGGSCLAITATYRERGIAPGRQHLALDPLQNTVWDDTGLLVVEQAGLAGYLEFQAEYSSLALPRLVETKAEFQLVYVDGSHLFEDVFVDFYYVGRLLSEGGIVVFDDSTNPNVSKVLGFVRQNLISGFKEIDLAPFRLDQGRSFKYKLAKRLGKVQMTAFQRVGPPVREWNSHLSSF